MATTDKVKTVPPKGLRFTQVEVENWRNFKSAQVSLQRRAFLVGPNASGKSNFLDVFRFLYDIVSVGGGLQQAVQLRDGVSRLRALTARQRSDISIRVQIGSDEEPDRWEYFLLFNQDPQRQAVVKEERVLRSGEKVLDRKTADEDDPELRTQTDLQQARANQDFREVASTLADIRYLHIVPQLIREPDRYTGKANDPYGSDFLDRIGATHVRTQRAWLRRIQDALAVAVPQLSDLEFFRDGQGRAHLRGKYEHWRPQGAWQEETQFSDGTLRLIGLLWSLLEGRGPLLLEEPEQSLHPEVVQYLPQMFARAQRRDGRQILVSTHSPDLLRDEGIGLDEVLLLIPEREGTVIKPASTIEDIRWLLEGGLNLAEAALPHTRPEKAHQLSLFER